MFRFFFISSIAFLLDFISKFLMRATFGDFETSLKYKVLPFFDLVEVHNYGVTFGLFNNMAHANIILSGFAFLMLCFVFYIFLLQKESRVTVPYAFVFGGGAGNLVDRLINGYVYDFIDFYIKEYHWPAFNIADSFITVGVFMILTREILKK